MERLTTTPFAQRPVTAALIEHVQAAMGRPSIPHINKWELFRNLCTGRAAFGVSDRDLTVLNALLSFHQDANLSDNDNLIVFPSNAALSERACLMTFIGSCGKREPLHATPFVACSGGGRIDTGLVARDRL